MKKDDIEVIRQKHLDKINSDGLRLKNLPNFIFLCGGDIRRKESEIQEQRFFSSMRGAIYELLLLNSSIFNRVKLAEDTKNWSDHGTINNLIDFELAIADMAGVIILILEGPGAYAELGSFSVLPSLSEKLILVVNQEIIDKKSFIHLGPIKYLDDNNRVVLRYDWPVKYIVNGQTNIKTYIEESPEDVFKKANIILENILEKEKQISLVSPVFDTSKKGHLCFLIGDLIYNFCSLKLREIKDYISVYFDQYEITDKEVKECLFILENFDFIKECDFGDKYYSPSNINNGFIKYSYNDAGYKNTFSDIRKTLLKLYEEYDISRFHAYKKGML